MIAELTNAVSFQEETIDDLTHHRTLFPAPATKGKQYHPLRVERSWTATYASPGAKVVDSVWIPPIPKACHLERTMLPPHCAAIDWRCCDFSMDQGERANLEIFSVTCHLENKSSASSSCQH